MERFSRWLHKEPKGLEILSLILGTAGCGVLLASGIGILLYTLGIQPPSRSMPVFPHNTIGLLLTLMMNAMHEELLFRLPLVVVIAQTFRMREGALCSMMAAIGIHYFIIFQHNPYSWMFLGVIPSLLVYLATPFRNAVLPFAAILSVIFGILHGGIIFIAIQGMLGFIFCLIFLKTGGLRGALVKPLLCSTATHAVYNVIFVIGSLFAGMYPR